MAIIDLRNNILLQCWLNQESGQAVFPDVNSYPPPKDYDGIVVAVDVSPFATNAERWVTGGPGGSRCSRWNTNEAPNFVFGNILRMEDWIFENDIESTYTIWIQPELLNGSLYQTPIASHYGDYNTGWSLEVVDSGSGYNVLQIWDSIDDEIFTSTTPLTLGEWYFVCITFNGDGDGVSVNGTGSIYINGEHDGDFSGLLVGSDGSDTFSLAGADDSQSCFKGKIDNVSYFNKVLNQEEIDFLYNDGNGTEELHIPNEFQLTYVKIAEATAASKDALNASVTPLSDTSDYDGNGSDGNIRVIVDTVSGPGITWDEINISPMQFELDNITPINSTFKQIQDLSFSNTPYNPIVNSLNNFVINNVLGRATENPTSIGGLYQTTLQNFIDIDCVWSDPSIGAPASWIELSSASGFDII
jgi:hypothetical protein